MITEPKITLRSERQYVGIRVKTPFQGMFAVADRLLKELRRWVKSHGIADEGPFFLRYHVVDMQEMMDIELGFMVRNPLQGDERVKPGVLPGWVLFNFCVNFCTGFSHPKSQSLLYKQSMNERAHAMHTGQNWTVFAALDLPFPVGAPELFAEVLESRLCEVLRPLNLPPEFAGKVLNFASASIARLHDGTALFRLLVFTPAVLPAHNYTWGFFRVVKHEEDRSDTTGRTRTLLIYLYVEGEPSQ
jgi:hypothetical protein